MDLVLDTTFGSGVTTGSGGNGETLTRRTPFFADVDLGVVLDGDYELEYGAGLTMQLETATQLTATPQVRLLRPVWIGEIYAGVGVPVVVAPILARLGAEIAAGILFRMHEQFSGLFTVAADVFFAGDDLPGDDPVVMFNMGLGGRVHF